MVPTVLAEVTLLAGGVDLLGDLGGERFDALDAFARLDTVEAVSILKEDKAMTVSECAYLIASGMQKRQREVVMTAQGKLGRFLKLLLPRVVENMALAALKDDVKPH